MGRIREGVAHAQEIAVGRRQVLRVSRQPESADRGQPGDDRPAARNEAVVFISLPYGHGPDLPPEPGPDDHHHRAGLGRRTRADAIPEGPAADLRQHPSHGRHLTYAAHRVFCRDSRWSENTVTSDISRSPPPAPRIRVTKAKPKPNDTYVLCRAAGFADWRLSIRAGYPARRCTRSSTSSDLPSRTQITRHTCEEAGPPSGNGQACR